MSTSPDGIFRDPGAPVEDRVDDLLARMTIEEKVAQLSGHFPFDFFGEAGFDTVRALKLVPHGLGQLSVATAVSPDSLEPIAIFLNDLQRFLKDRTRLGIPAICHSEALAGLLHARAASFPAPLALAATWDPPLVTQMNSVVRRQMRALGIHQALAPVLDVARDARWGRVSETYGEDAYLCSSIGAAFVRGLHGADLRSGVLATGKHFVAYSASEGGRNFGPSTVSEQDLMEVYTRPFEVAIRDGGLASVMSAYTELNGVPCSGSHWLLTTVLREKLGFSGFVVADYGSIAQLLSLHATSSDLTSAGLAALSAGLDVELPGTVAYGSRLVDATRSALIGEDVIDRSVRRVLKEKFRLGLFEDPFVPVGGLSRAFDPQMPHTTALELARKSIVLLANDGTLPLRGDLSRVAVIGPNADSVRNLFSGYSPPAGMELVHAIMHGQAMTMAGLFDAEISEELTGGSGDEEERSPGPDTISETFGTVTDNAPDEVLAAIRMEYPTTPTVLEAITDLVSDSTVVAFDPGCELNGQGESIERAAEAAAGADVAILVLGDKSGWTYDATSGEGRDRSSLRLPGRQEELLNAVCKTGTPVIVVLVNGRPLPVPDTDPPVRAIIEAWQPGAVGGTAIAEVLFGILNPGGRLPITIPRSAGQCPLYYARKPGAAYSGSDIDAGYHYTNEPATPAFAFGHGLSYTTFGYDRLKATLSDGHLHVRARLANTGGIDGDEVVQVYLRQTGTELTQPLQRLVAFARVHCEAGASRDVTFEIPSGQLATLGSGGRRTLEKGTIAVMVGSSSSNIRRTARVEVFEPVALREGDSTFLSSVDVRQGWD
jgi:beta-glucosidase-like glycosyl hydrolase